MINPFDGETGLFLKWFQVSTMTADAWGPFYQHESSLIPAK